MGSDARAFTRALFIGPISFTKGHPHEEAASKEKAPPERPWLSSALLLERGELFGWEDTTPIDLLAEMETTRLIISRHSPFCCVSGDGSFWYMLHLGDKSVCEKCASEVSRILADYCHHMPR